MALNLVIQNLATRIGTEFKSIRTLVGGTGTAGVTSLNTTATNLVAAINEVKATADFADATATAGLKIDDVTLSGTTVYSSTKTNTEINSKVSVAINAAIDNAPAALNTLNELAAALGDDANFAGTVTTGLANRLRHDAAQTLGTAAQLQACLNIGVGNPETNFVTTFETAIV
jgi:hypothetical protein